MAIPQSIIEQFFGTQGIKNTIIDDYGYTASISPNGDFRKYNGKELAIYRVVVLLCTTAGTYINDPDFGLDISIYTKLTSSVVESIKNEIKRKISKYEKDLKIVSITSDVNTTYKTVTLNLCLRYGPTGETVSLDFGFIKEMQSLAMRAISND